MVFRDGVLAIKCVQKSNDRSNEESRVEQNGMGPPTMGQMAKGDLLHWQ